MVYFIADTHFGHNNIIKSCNRPFAESEEMDAALVRNWNSRVQSCDDVYILGDLIFRSDKHAEKYLDALRGRKHLLVGNHDKYWMRNTDASRYFESVEQIQKINFDGITAVLCHYPILEWDGYYSGSYMIFGHIHNSLPVYHAWRKTPDFSHGDISH